MKTISFTATVAINNESVEKIFQTDIAPKTIIDVDWMMTMGEKIASRYTDSGSVCVQDIEILGDTNQQNAIQI